MFVTVTKGDGVAAAVNSIEYIVLPSCTGRHLVGYIQYRGIIALRHYTVSELKFFTKVFFVLVLVALYMEAITLTRGCFVMH